MASGIETEVKISLARVKDLADRVHAAGLRVSLPRVFEANTLYDTPDQALRRAASILRVREAGDRVLLTWKARRDSRNHKSREELETAVESGAALHQILAQLGYSPVFRYEKYRTEFKNEADPCGLVMLDETPIGDFLEIEGPAEWIDATAQRLGFTPEDYIVDSYGALYVADCRRRGVEPDNMVFPSHSM
ncbi:MAG: class IV adenylate cyclase [Acidobacteriaceae bacterium]|nr:class IV adenylate cyclase [Acidobacteriaceae bacterium]